MNEQEKAYDTETVREKINASPFYRLMGIVLMEMQPGYSRLEAELGDDHLNVYGTVHGGVCASLIDCAVGTALIGTIGDVERPSPTVEMKVNYLAPVTDGKLIVEGRLVHRGRTLAVGLAEVRRESGELVAVGTATYMSSRPQSSGPVSSATGGTSAAGNDPRTFR
ncbi:MAG TPA: PaaI family thioesterase [Firmicutes bacterium]|nr:PaaI family thioesterase [Bacillota bacterium]